MVSKDKQSAHGEGSTPFPADILAKTLEHKLKTLPESTVCIYRVSEKLRKSNEEAYTPRLVSIGPIHSKKTHLKAMEARKLRWLRDFVHKHGVDLRKLIDFVVREENVVRGCYEDTSMFASDEFSQMILLDGIFLIQLLLKNYSLGHRELVDSMIFGNRWILSDILHDMLLIENQLPLTLIQRLFEFVDFPTGPRASLQDLIWEFFKDVGKTRNIPLNSDLRGARHFVEFLLHLHAPLSGGQEPASGRKFEYTRSAAELKQAGVKYKRAAQQSSLFEIKFNETSGELEAPGLVVNDFTETFFRNLIAFEQCGYHSKHITSYVIFMDSLINTSEDVDLLVSSEILYNRLGESQKIADIFNNLHKELVEDSSDFYFASTCENLNKYSKDPWHEIKARWHRYKVILGRDYFGSPWSTISVLAAFLALVLTGTQAVCSILQVS